MSVLVIILTIGLVARATRLITTDYITRHLRAFSIGRLGPGHDIPYLLTCPWCLSMWIAAAVVPVAWFYGDTAAYMIVATVGTASYAAGVAATFVEADD